MTSPNQSNTSRGRLTERLKSAGDHYGIPVERDFAEAASAIDALTAERDALREALKDIAYLRPLGPTRNKLAMQMERIALDALGRAALQEQKP